MQFTLNILWVTLTKKLITCRVFKIHKWIWWDMYEWGKFSLTMTSFEVHFQGTIFEVHFEVQFWGFEVHFKVQILRYILRYKFWGTLFWGTNFEVCFEVQILRYVSRYILRYMFWGTFWGTSFEVQVSRYKFCAGLYKLVPQDIYLKAPVPSILNRFLQTRYHLKA